MGYDVYNWTFGYDWNYIDLDKLVDMYVKNIKPGAILLLHDTEKRKGRIIELTKRIIENAKSQGYEILRLDEMIFK
jgi:peptidoglycan/xylan/chitin deacetylase (PgdA/CDA1 family)